MLIQEKVQSPKSKEKSFESQLKSFTETIDEIKKKFEDQEDVER